MGENCYQLHIDNISAGPDLNVCTYCQPPAFICFQALLFVQIFGYKKKENIQNNERLQRSWNSIITQINLKISIASQFPRPWSGTYFGIVVLVVNFIVSSRPLYEGH